MKNIMKSIFPAPLLSVALLVLWLLLNRSVSAGQILLGLILGLLIPVLLRGLRPLPVRVSHPLSILKLAFRVVCDTSVSNFNVVRFLLLPRMRKHPAAFVHIPLELRDPNGLAVLAMIVCLTPGTSWAEISRDRSMLLLHALEVEDAKQMADFVKSRYESLLMEIFE
ncbi:MULTISPECIES: Na+/H+ antiporter subunit E [Comamonas]|uniref:Na+/H+ antiporter subunit E n=1 Tax=Comamonas TaxID=283 RepID=UPI000552DB7C|nr:MULTISPECIES: Na+/H+ antiporter subunit E [Comamonas]MCO8250334.1 Na+/H+ antiporter subunit E [Comamonas thiooxydans]OAD82702.1 cation:proton antiporter [Comamonas thiooxydans]TZG08185.1 Na+/H+ antiporter subunit E [Comamonas thiooxydans]UBQ43282.1 Na+/H+ antiporter subunit E [Comamonas thiooxydans]UNV89654.1 Na+/H+ antiporter subunit E [Comamonas sp. 7D-2evo1]